MFSLLTFKVSEFQINPAAFRNKNKFKAMIVPPKLDIVDSTPGAAIYAMKIYIGKKVNTFSNVSLKICEKQ